MNDWKAVMKRLAEQQRRTEQAIRDSEKVNWFDSVLVLLTILLAVLLLWTLICVV